MCIIWLAKGRGWLGGPEVCSTGLIEVMHGLLNPMLKNLRFFAKIKVRLCVVVKGHSTIKETLDIL